MFKREGDVEQSVLGSAMILGASALLVNMISYVALPNLLFPAGNLFLLWSAQALGVYGALVSAALSLVPEVVYTTDMTFGVRWFVITMAVALCAEKKPIVPSFIVVLALWLAVFGPVSYYLSTLLPWTSPFRFSNMIFKGFAEVLLAAVSGTILLHHNIWRTTTKTPQNLSLLLVLTHVFTLCSTLTLLLTFLATQDVSFLFNPANYQDQSIPILITMLACFIAPPLLAIGMSSLFETNLTRYVPSSSLMETDKILSALSLSGLTEQVWEQQSQQRAPVTGSTLITPKPAAPTPPSSVEKPKITPHIGICKVGSKNTVEFANRKFQKIVGLKEETQLGNALRELDIEPQLLKNLHEVVATTRERGAKHTEVRIGQTPSSQRFLELHAVTADRFESSSLGGTADSVVITVQDITHRRTVESHLLEGQRLASLGNMMKGIVHTFNNALTIIAGLSSCARQSNDEFEVKTSLATILTAAQNAGLLSRQLINFADGEPELFQPHPSATLIEDRIELFKNLAGESIDIQFISSSKQLPIICDPNLLTQALTNLIINGKEAIDSEGGKIVIRIAEETVDSDISDHILGASPGHFVRIQIEDNGRGMTPEQLARAFEPFFTTKMSRGNVGLGLSTVHAILRAHDGFLTMESQPRKGAKVSMYIPFYEDKAQEISTPEIPDIWGEQPISSSITGDSRGRAAGRIMVVEDDLQVCQVVVTMLKILGYDVISYNSGVAALKGCEEEEFDVILADLVMPKVSGLEVIKKAREKRNDLPAFLMTGYGLDAQSNCENIPVIPKPFDLHTLREALK